MNNPKQHHIFLTLLAWLLSGACLQVAIIAHPTIDGYLSFPNGDMVTAFSVSITDSTTGEHYNTETSGNHWVVLNTTSTGIGNREVKRDFKMAHVFTCTEKTLYYAPVYLPSNGRLRITIHNILGQTMDKTSQSLTSGNYAIRVNTAGFATGVYILAAQFNGQQHSQRLLVFGQGNKYSSGKVIEDIVPGGTLSKATVTNNDKYQSNLLQKPTNTATIDVRIQSTTNPAQFEDMQFYIPKTDTTVQSTAKEILNGPQQLSLNFNEGDSASVALDYSSPTGVQSYTIQDLNELLTSAIENDSLKIIPVDGDVNGNYNAVMRIELGKGTTYDIPINTTINAQPDVTGLFRDPVLRKNVDNLTLTLQGKKYSIIPSDSGLFKAQLVPGAATLATDTTGNRMQTQWNLGTLTGEDVELDTIPAFYKNPNMELMVDVKGSYGSSDRNTFATNKIWNPNIHHEGPPKGTLKTLYVNYDSNIGSDNLRKANLDWLIDKSKLSVDDKVRLQMPSEATVVDISVSDAYDEGKIGGDFLDGKIYSDYDVIVVIGKYISNTNYTNANLVEGYTTKGVINLRAATLGPARGGSLSEATTVMQNTADVTPARRPLAEGTMYGTLIPENHEQGYLPTVLYGPNGNQIQLSPEEHVGKVSMNLPLDSRIEQERIVLPARQ